MGCVIGIYMGCVTIGLYRRCVKGYIGDVLRVI